MTYLFLNTKRNGGAISFSDASARSKLLVEKCVFERCHTVADLGGAIYMFKDGNCVVNQCCSIECSSDKKGQFIYSEFQTSSDGKNQVLDSSVIDIFNTEGSTIHLRYGNITIETVNCSSNKCRYIAYCLITQSKEDDLFCTINFCSFTNNEGSRGVHLERASSTNAYSCTHLQNSNFISNSCTNLIHNIQTYLTVSHCTILQNQGNTIFSCASNAAHKAYHFIIVKDCTCDSFKTSGNVNLDSIKPLTSFINPVLPHFLTDLCPVHYDVIDPLTPEKTPDETPEITPKQTWDKSLVTPSLKLPRIFST